MPHQTHIIGGLVNGDQSAFKRLYLDYYDDLVLYANRILTDMDDAHDMVQFVMAKLWEKRESLGDVRDLKSYLFRSVHNSCLNKIKKRKYFSAYKDETWHQIKEIELDGHQAIKTEELSTEIKTAIDKLSPQCRKVFVLSRFEYKSYQQIADELKISVKAVEGNMSRALKQLRLDLSEYFVILFFIFFL